MNHAEQKRQHDGEIARAVAQQAQRLGLAEEMDRREVCTACRVIGMLQDILENTSEIAEGLGVNLENPTGGPWWHEELGGRLEDIQLTTFHLAEELGINLLGEDEKEAPKP